jgi:hypothetical protein
MLPSKYFLNLVFILTLVLSALSSTTTSVSAENDNNALKANPRLLPMAEEGPDAILKVIVQKDVQNKDLKNIEVEDEILKGGGQVNPLVSVLNILPLFLLYQGLRVPALLRQMQELKRQVTHP